MSLIFDRSNRAFVPPIDGLRQLIAGSKSVAIALPRAKESAFPVDLAPQKPGPVLVVGEISEAVEAELEGPVGGVVGVDKADIILKDLEASLLLAEGVVGFGVLDKPRFVHGPHLRLAPLGGDHNAVLSVVVYD